MSYSSFNNNNTSINPPVAQSSVLNLHRPNILLTELSMRKNKTIHNPYFSKLSINSNITTVNKSTQSFMNLSRNHYIKNYTSNLTFLHNKKKKKGHITLKDAKLIGISPFFINSFFSTNIKNNPNINELYLLKRIKLQNTIVDKMGSTMKENATNTINNEKPCSRLDFLAFDNYAEKVKKTCFSKSPQKREKLQPIYKLRLKKNKIQIIN